MLSLSTIEDFFLVQVFSLSSLESRAVLTSGSAFKRDDTYAHAWDYWYRCLIVFMDVKLGECRTAAVADGGSLSHFLM